VANLVRLGSSNDILQVDAGGAIMLNGGEIRSGVTRIIPPPLGTPDGYAPITAANAPGGVLYQATPVLAIVTFKPTAVGSSYTKQLAIIAKGEVVVSGWAFIDTTSDNGSTGAITVTGDTWSLLAVNFAPSGDLYGGANTVAVNLLASGQEQLASSSETITLVWTPGMTPGATAPSVRFALLTQQMF
jgi:hypothetical protein